MSHCRETLKTEIRLLISEAAKLSERLQTLLNEAEAAEIQDEFACDRILLRAITAPGQPIKVKLKRVGDLTKYVENAATDPAYLEILPKAGIAQ